MSAPSIGDRIRAARKAKGLSLADVGAVLGVSVPFLHDVEHDKRRVTRERAPAFAKVLDLKITDLMTPDPDTLDLVIAELVELGGCERAVLRLRELRGAS